jgi:hypothetical protein
MERWTVVTVIPPVRRALSDGSKLVPALIAGFVFGVVVGLD